MNHSVIVITFMLAQSDSIKRRALYFFICANISMIFYFFPTEIEFLDRRHRPKKLDIVWDVTWSNQDRKRFRKSSFSHPTNICIKASFLMLTKIISLSRSQQSMSRIGLKQRWFSTLFSQWHNSHLRITEYPDFFQG